MAYLTYSLAITDLVINPIALRMAKTQWVLAILNATGLRVCTLISQQGRQYNLRGMIKKFSAQYTST